jgi:hypothetical protein
MVRLHLYRLALAGGLALLGYGVALVHLPAALMVSGGLIAVAAFCGLGLDGGSR